MVINNIDKFIHEHNIGTIYLDVDGVIFASCQALVDILNKKNGTNYSGEDVLSWNFKEVAPNITEKEVEDLFNDDEFFEMVKPIKGALRFLDTYRKSIIIVTKCNPNNAIKKYQWFEKNGFGDIPIIPLPLSIQKNIIDMTDYILNDDKVMTLFIDDSTYNLDNSYADYRIQFREYQDEKNRSWQNEWNGYIMYGWE